MPPEKRPAMVEDRIADEVVGDELEIREGQVAGTDQIEERGDRLIGAAVEPAEKDAVAGEAELHGWSGPERS